MNASDVSPGELVTSEMSRTEMKELKMQIPSSTHSESEDALFIERRNVYGCGMVVLTASISNGVVLLEQHPEYLTISRELHALIPLISVEGIERLEAFLATVKKQMRALEKKKRRPTTARHAG